MYNWSPCRCLHSFSEKLNYYLLTYLLTYLIFISWLAWKFYINLEQDTFLCFSYQILAMSCNGVTLWVSGHRKQASLGRGGLNFRLRNTDMWPWIIFQNLYFNLWYGIKIAWAAVASKLFYLTDGKMSPPPTVVYLGGGVRGKLIIAFIIF